MNEIIICGECGGIEIYVYYDLRLLQFTFIFQYHRNIQINHIYELKNKIIHTIIYRIKYKKFP